MTTTPDTAPDRPLPDPDVGPHPEGPSAPGRSAASVAVRATAVIATVAMVVAVLGFAALLRPVRSPVQDCGTALAFLLDGRTDVFVDPANPPEGVTEQEARESNERPCRPRVLDAARPGAVAFIAGVVVATLAALVELGVRGTRWWRLRSTRSTSAPAAGRGPEPGAHGSADPPA